MEISFQDLQGLQEDWQRIDIEAVNRRKELLDLALHYERSAWIRAVQAVRDGRARLVERYAYGFSDRLEVDSSVAATPHPSRLLELAVNGTHETHPHRQRWFDAISLFDQALAIAKIEERNPYEAVGRDLERLIDFLSERFFEPGYNSVDFYVYHDPQADYTVGMEDVGVNRSLSHRQEGRTRRTNRLTCRKTKEGELVFLHHRIKGGFEEWLKIQRQVTVTEHRTNPFLIRDRCGLMFVVEDREKALEIAQRIIAHLTDEGVVVEPLQHNFLSDTQTDSGNHHSETAHKFAKLVLKWKGREFELQFSAFHDYFNARASLTDANHELYKLRQALDHSFPQIWPPEIYSIRWENPMVRHMMRGWMVAKLGWRVNGE